MTAFQFLKHIVSFDLPIVLSTGLANYSEIDAAISFINSQGKAKSKKNELSILQCTSMYPIGNEDANLAVIGGLKNRYPNNRIGYSDHTRGTEACKLAIALGAEILEVHFTDKSIKSDFRDHIVSLDADDIKSLRKHAEVTSELLGSKDKKLTDIEHENNHHVTFRRALYLNKNMKKGSIIEATDIISLRPEVGIPANYFENLSDEN